MIRFFDEAKGPSRIHSESALLLPKWTIGYIRAYCEFATCQVRELQIFLRTYDSEETIGPRNLSCPICGNKTSSWLEFEGLNKEDTQAVAKANDLEIKN